MAIRLRPGEENFIRILRDAKIDPSVFAAVQIPTVRTIASKKEMANGGGFPCTATNSCKRRLKTPARAAIHVTTNADLQVRGHRAR